MSRILAYLSILLLFSCNSQVATRSYASNQSSLEEFRIALIDIQQSMSSQQMDIQLLEEKISKLKTGVSTPATSPSLEAKLREIEKLQNTLSAEIEQLHTFANQTTQSLLQFRNQINLLDKQLQQQTDRLSEISKLKTTLHSISKSIRESTGEKLYRVCSGDSLEKIARQFNTSIESLKKLNHLQTDKIIVGQELKISE